MRRQKRRRNPVLPWLAAFAALAVALWLLLVNVVFVVRHVDVSGAGSVSEAEVVHLSGIQLGARIGDVDWDRVPLNVESTGRLAFVSLERTAPNRLLLTVRERTRDAMIPLIEAGKILVVDEQGYVVEARDTLPEGVMPYVTGIRSSAYQLGRQLDRTDGRCDALAAILTALRAQGGSRYASEIDLTALSDLKIVTRTGMVVLLGNAEQMPVKIAWMIGTLNDLEARGETRGQLDVSSGVRAYYRPPVTEETTENGTAQPEALGS